MFIFNPKKTCLEVKVLITDFNYYNLTLYKLQKYIFKLLISFKLFCFIFIFIETVSMDFFANE